MAICPTGQNICLQFLWGLAPSYSKMFPKPVLEIRCGAGHNFCLVPVSERVPGLRMSRSRDEEGPRLTPGKVLSLITEGWSVHCEGGSW